MIIIFFTVIGIEAGRIYINVTMYANRFLSLMSPKTARAQAIMARIGIALDIAALAITGFMMYITFGTFSCVLLAFASVGYAASIISKQRTIQSIKELTYLNNIS